MSEMGTFSANMQPEQTKVSCVLKMSDGLSSKSLGYLSLLYRPLIKVRPYLLYGFGPLAELREKLSYGRSSELYGNEHRTVYSVSKRA